MEFSSKIRNLKIQILEEEGRKNFTAKLLSEIEPELMNFYFQELTLTYLKSIAPGSYDLKVELVGTEQKLWRSFQLPKSATFKDLHEAIQQSCDWHDAHLYNFVTKYAKGGEEIADRQGLDGNRSDQIYLAEYFETNKGCTYT
ncbi:MAG: hypothetical protein EOP04_22785, partial [Proteobacteria bacterium]